MYQRVIRRNKSNVTRTTLFFADAVKIQWRFKQGQGWEKEKSKKVSFYCYLRFVAKCCLKRNQSPCNMYLYVLIYIYIYILIIAIVFLFPSYFIWWYEANKENVYVCVRVNDAYETFLSSPQGRCLNLTRQIDYKTDFAFTLVFSVCNRNS